MVRQFFFFFPHSTQLQTVIDYTSRSSIDINGVWLYPEPRSHENFYTEQKTELCDQRSTSSDLLPAIPNVWEVNKVKNLIPDIGENTKPFT